MYRPTLEQAMEYFEYALAKGMKSWDRADEVLEDMFAHGEVVNGEMPRIVTYYAGMDRRYAIAAVDNTFASDQGRA